MRSIVENDTPTSVDSAIRVENNYDTRYTREGSGTEAIGINLQEEVQGEIGALVSDDSYSTNIDAAVIMNNDPSTSSPVISVSQSADDNVAQNLSMNTAMCIDTASDPAYTSAVICEPSEIPVENLCEPVLESNKKTGDSRKVQRVPNVGINRGVSSEWSKSTDNWESFTRSTMRKDDATITTRVPASGTAVCPKSVKRAGPYILGPLIGTSPVKSIVQCLARKAGTDKFYTIKILTLKDENEYTTQDDRQGKMLLHAEYSLLSLLQNQDGVVHHHGFFKVCFNIFYSPVITIRDIRYT